MSNKKYNIEYNGLTFEASQYQSEIFNAIEHKTGNLVINAAAGSSKTTTIVNAIRFIPEKKKIMFIAFNRDIVKKIKENVSHPNANILTFHSLGFYILLENGLIKREDDFIDEYKYTHYIRENKDELLSETNKNVLKKNYSQFLNNVNKLVDYSRYYLAFSEKEIKQVSEIYDIVLFDNEIEICRKVLQWGKRHLKKIDYTDLLWLPNVLNLTTKKYTYNWIFVDEAQDTNIAEQELVKKCFKRGTRFAIVCDNFQQINVWAGSTIRAIENFKDFPNTKEYKLPISYRCPKKIVNLASQYSNNIVASDNAIDGEINYDVQYTQPVSGDMVLCRMTAPLIQLYLKYLKLNKKACIKGFENIKDDYISLIKQSNSLLIDKECLTSDGLFPKIYRQFVNHIENVSKTFSLTFDESMQHSIILMEYDVIEGLKTLSEGLVTVDELLNRINTIFQDNGNEGVILSTIHKAKGLESDNVYIFYPSLLNSRKNIKEWEKQLEENLIYVAYTRAKKTLNFIKEEKNNIFLQGNEVSNKLIKEEIENIINKINFNKENLISEANIKQTLKPIKEFNILGNKTENNKVQNNKKKPLGKFKFC
jgi:superfamily I DNA/RNA helicase